MGKVRICEPKRHKLVKHYLAELWTSTGPGRTQVKDLSRTVLGSLGRRSNGGRGGKVIGV